MLKHSITVLMCTACALCMAGPERSAAATDTKVIRIATLAPRDSVFTRAIERLGKRIQDGSKGEVELRLYTSGSEGDESTVIRKMRTGQLDSGMITSDGLGIALPEVTVLRAPGVVVNYKQLHAVQDAVRPEFGKALEQKGYKLIAWGEAGEYRYFSKTPIRTPSDFRTMRPWLWPSSPVMVETWRAIGATGVPLGMGEVFGALQTGMVDLVESTAIAYIALQWHMTPLSYMTEDTSGVLMGAWLMNKSTFDSLTPASQQLLLKLADENAAENRARTRDADGQAYTRLMQRGLKLSKLTPEGKAQMEEIRKQVRQRLIGRAYSADLLARVQKIADEYR